MRSFLKIILETLPLIGFFIAFILHGMIKATIVLLVLTFICAVISYLYEKKINKFSTISFIILGVFGLLTIYTNNTVFIKMKPTILPLIVAAVLFYSIHKKQLVLKKVFAEHINLQDQVWNSFSKRFAYYLIFLAILNELVWRNVSDYAWVKFKVFIVLPLTLAFFALNVFVSYKENEKL